jgi:hypothetical protein
MNITQQKQLLVSLLDKVSFFPPIFDYLAGNGVRFQMVLKINMNKVQAEQISRRNKYFVT